MKIKRKILSVILSLLVIFQIITNININVYATSSINTFHVGTFDNYSVYEYDNPNALPNSFSIYWVYGGKVCTAPATKWLVAALNKKLGTTFTSNWFTDFNSYFMTQIMTATSLATDFFSGGVTRVSNGSAIVGVAFNDLTGLTLEQDIPSNATLITPSNVCNVTFNILHNYLEDNPETPPYIIVETLNKQLAIQNIGTLADNPDYWQNSYDRINEYVTGNILMSGLGPYTTNYWRFYRGNYDYFREMDISDTIFSMTSADYTSLVNDFSLTENSNRINLTDLTNYTSNIIATFSDLNGNSKTINYTSMKIDKTDVNTGSSTSTYVYFYSRSGNRSLQWYPIYEDGFVTIYQSNLIPQQISNNTYQKNIYKSTTYNNYNNTSTENNFTITNQQITNSQTTNENIYNETKTTVNENIANNNYNIDNSVNDNSVTYIINNYYNENGGGDDPDDPDDDDDSVWKALLKAIAGFFEKIGELIATLLTGIFSIFTSILDAITSITQDFTSITSFISSFFSWLPTPITELIVLGLGLALICAFLTWFKK